MCDTAHLAVLSVVDFPTNIKFFPFVISDGGQVVHFNVPHGKRRGAAYTLGPEIYVIVSPSYVCPRGGRVSEPGPEGEGPSRLELTPNNT